MKRVVVVAAVLVLAALPAVADNYLLRLATIMLMYSALALGWNFIGGFAGYPSFATAAFFGLGAYAGGVLQTRGVPMPAAWLLAGAIVALFAAALGRAILHLRGH
jgi:branched-chain amino acid transport system permease protein